MTYTFKISSDVRNAVNDLSRLRTEVGHILAGVNKLNGVKNVNLHVNSNLKNINQELDHVNRNLSQIKSKSGGGMGSMFGGLRGMVAGYLGYQGVQEMLQTGMQRERMGYFINTFSDSKEEARGLTKEILNMGVALGVNVTYLQETYGMMAQVTSKANALEMTKRVGMLSGFTGFDPKTIGINIMQMMAAGKGYADLRDIRQTFEKYPLFMKYLAEVKKISISKLNKGLAKGKFVTGNEVMQAIDKMSNKNSELAKFYKEYTKSLPYKWNMMTMEIQNTLVAIYEALKPVINGLANFFIRLTRHISEFAEWMRSATPAAQALGLALRVVGIALASIFVVSTIKSMATAMASLVTATGGWALAIAVAVIGLGMAYDKIKELQYQNQTIKLEGATILPEKDMSVGGTFGRSITNTIHDIKGEKKPSDFAMTVGQAKFKLVEMRKLRDDIIFNMQKSDYNKIWSENDKKLLDKYNYNIPIYEKALSPYEGEKDDGKIGNAVKNWFSDINLKEFKLGYLDFGNMKGVNDAAENTSNGFYGRQRVINLYFQKELISVSVPGGNGTDIINKAPTAAEMIIRVLNNISQ